jgi:hypothetical protein
VITSSGVTLNETCNKFCSSSVICEIFRIVKFFTKYFSRFKTRKQTCEIFQKQNLRKKMSSLSSEIDFLYSTLNEKQLIYKKKTFELEILSADLRKLESEVFQSNTMVCLNSKSSKCN